nr:MAG TPA_asm: hypothetical protein [Caudoviricetes sp.]
MISGLIYRGIQGVHHGFEYLVFLSPYKGMRNVSRT